MSLGTIQFNEGTSGLGRPLDSVDHISGLSFYNVASLPSGFASTSIATRTKVIFSPADAITAGIKNDFSDATAAQGVYTVTAIGANGDTLELKVADINNVGATQSTSLGVYTKTAAETTVALIATAYAAIINAGTPTHGYSATTATGAITIIAPKRLGAYLNTGTPLSATITGTITGTITSQVGVSVAGVASKLYQYYFHISEFFRMQPKGFLAVNFNSGAPTSFSEITDMQTYVTSIGYSMRQVGVFKDGIWATADITALQAIGVANKSLYAPLSIVYAANLVATTDITTIADVSTLNAPLVSTCIGQDGSGPGYFTYLTSGGATKISITNLGTEIGGMAERKVSESIAWVGQTNLSNGTTNETPMFCNGQLYSALAKSALDALDTKGHIFMIKIPNYTGTYFNSSRTCVTSTSDYATIELNRTICKAERLLSSAYAPYLSSPLLFNANGTLTNETIANLESVGNAALDQMVRDSELSAKSVTINPSQNTLSTQTLTLSVVLVPLGVARNITINIGYKTSI